MIFGRKPKTFFTGYASSEFGDLRTRNQRMLTESTTTSNQGLEFHYEDSYIDSLSPNIEDIIRLMGDDPSREGLKDTPKRVLKSYKELFKGYDKNNKPNITVFTNGKDGMMYDEMIIDSGKFYSHCEHHMIPFFGSYHFCYIPRKKIMGLSKVARVVDYYSSKLQIQERLVKEIVDEIEDAVKPLGIGLIMKGRHLCKEMRGIKQCGEMVTSDLRGRLRTRPEARAEFIKFIK